MNQNYPYHTPSSYGKRLSISLDITPKEDTDTPESTYLSLFHELERLNIPYNCTELFWRSLCAKDDLFIEQFSEKWLQNRSDEEKHLLLWQACYHDRVDLLKRLVNQGVDPSLPRENDYPLNFACEYESIGCIDYLFPLTPDAEKIALEYSLPKEWISKNICLPALNPDFITPSTEKENLGYLVSDLKKPLAEEVYQSFLEAFCRINAFSAARDLVQKQQTLTFRPFIQSRG